MDRDDILNLFRGQQSPTASPRAARSGTQSRRDTLPEFVLCRFHGGLTTSRGREIFNGAAAS